MYTVWVYSLDIPDAVSRRRVVSPMRQRGWSDFPGMTIWQFDLTLKAWVIWAID